jgi:DNA mismatch repair ATPase MutS
MRFHSILFQNPEDERETPETPPFFHDLNLDQIVEAITSPWKEYDLASLFRISLGDLKATVYRQDIMRDLENQEIAVAVKSFSQQMRAVRQYSNQADKSRYRYEKERWFLDGVETYCEAVEKLAANLSQMKVQSCGMKALGNYLAEYVDSTSFKELSSKSQRLVSDLSSIEYGLLIKEGKFTVCRYDGEIDYSIAVEQTFEKFRRGAVKSYLARISSGTGMNHIQAQVVQGIAQLFPEIFAALEAFYAGYSNYLDPAIARFDREVHFYIAYLNYLGNFLSDGLSFCYPRLSRTSKEIKCRDAFDMALAGKRNGEKAKIVTNDFHLSGPERVMVISGPNQGGKTTLARTFGQMHYLASLGCQVPGTEAQLFFFDRLFTHFEREEDIKNLRGKLHDDLVRIREILDAATPNSIVIMNELFSSTTLQDAVYLSRKIMERISTLNLLSVWVTFLVELTTFNEKTVSVVSTVDPRDPAIRTFKLERQPARGVAYALAVAEKYGVTYARAKERLTK